MTAVKNVSELHRHRLNVTFRVFELRIYIYPSIAHSSIKSIHNHGQFYRPQWAWHSTHKDCLPWVQGVRTVHHKIRVIKIPWSDLNLDFIWVKKETLSLTAWKADLADPLSWRRYYYNFGDTIWDMKLTGLSLMVGLDTHRYNLSSCWKQASMSFCTDCSSKYNRKA